MAGKRPFEFEKKKNRNPQNTAPERAPAPQRPMPPRQPQQNRNEGRPELKNEWFISEGPFYVYALLTKAAGYVESGVFNKKKLFNVHLHVEAKGGDLASIEATYQSKSGERPIKGISEKCFDATFDVPVEGFVGTHLKVNIEYKFKVGVFKRKPFFINVFLPH